MTIAEICIAAREKGMTYGQYVSECLPHYTPPVKSAPLEKTRSHIYQYTKDGQLIGVYPSIKAAEDAIGGGNIWRAVKQNSMSMGFYWRRDYRGVDQ